MERVKQNRLGWMYESCGIFMFCGIFIEFSIVHKIGYNNAI